MSNNEAVPGNTYTEAELATFEAMLQADKAEWAEQDRIRDEALEDSYAADIDEAEEGCPEYDDYSEESFP